MIDHHDAGGLPQRDCQIKIYAASLLGNARSHSKQGTFCDMTEARPDYLDVFGAYVQVDDASRSLHLLIHIVMCVSKLAWSVHSKETVC